MIISQPANVNKPNLGYARSELLWTDIERVSCVHMLPIYIQYTQVQDEKKELRMLEKIVMILWNRLKMSRNNHSVSL